MLKTSLGSLVLIAALLLSACAARSPVASESSFDSTARAGDAEMAVEAPVAEPAAAEDSIAQNGMDEDGANVADTRQVITTGHMELVVEDAGAAADGITSLVNSVGGYIGATNLYQISVGSGQALRGTITLRVPADRLDEVIAALEEMAVDVRSENLSRQDVTDQFSDTQAQLRALTATEEELLELLSDVRNRPNATADEIMSVYTRITEIRTQIERLQGRLNLLEDQVRLSTLEVSLIPDASNQPVVQAGWQPGEEARAALRTLISATQGVADLLIWGVLFLLPLLLMLLIPVVIAGLIVRYFYRRYMRNRKPTPTPTGPTSTT